MPGAGDERFPGRQVHSRAVAAGARERCPEVAARAGLAECQRRQVLAGGDLLEYWFDGGTRARRGDARGGTDRICENFL